MSDSTASVYIVPDFFVFELLHSRWTNMGGLPAVSVFENPLFGVDGVEWFVPFAPLRGMNEIQAVVLDKSNFLELAGKEWNALAQGVSKILKFYEFR